MEYTRIGKQKAIEALGFYVSGINGSGYVLSFPEGRSREEYFKMLEDLRVLGLEVESVNKRRLITSSVGT